MFVACLNKYRAILPFEPIQFPPLTILTGLNGSGKSQLLAGLEAQVISCDLFGPVTHSNAPQPTSNLQIVRIRNWDNISKDSGLERPSRLGERFGRDTPFQRPKPLRYQFKIKRAETLKVAQALLDEALGQSTATFLAEHEDPWGFSAIELVARAGIEPTDVLSNKVTSIFQAADFALSGSSNTANDSFFYDIGRATREFAVKRLAVNQEMIDALQSRYETGMFSLNTVEIMSGYRDQRFLNDMDEIQARRDSTKKFLAPDDFVKQYGPPPWESISDLLAAMSLPFEIIPPTHDMSEAVRFRLRSIDGGAELRFDELSSGEQVLLHFAISVMRPNPMMVGLKRPRLLLLDEMDASLHPEMAQRWLSAVERGIVGELGINVILTTHSPTTVAMAPENSIFAMIGGRPRQVSKQEAINKLTFGVPTLSIDYSGRRQVFCESDTDAAAYETIYAAVKPQLLLTKEINFIGTGIRDKSKIVKVGVGEEINAGEAVVREIVENLAKLSVSSVYGLVDWDSRAIPTDRVFVMGFGTYYTIENILLDPLLIGALMVIERMESSTFMISRRGLDALDESSLQELADAVQSRIVFPDDDGSMIDVRYVGGKHIRMKKLYASISGHELESLLAATFGSLKRYTSNRGTLTRRIAEIVITEYPEFCPKVISDTFEKISSF